MEVQPGVVAFYSFILVISEGNKVTETFVCLFVFFQDNSIFLLQRYKACNIKCKYSEDLCVCIHVFNFSLTLPKLSFTSFFLSLTILVTMGWPPIHTSPLYTGVFRSMEFPLIMSFWSREMCLSITRRFI